MRASDDDSTEGWPQGVEHGEAREPVARVPRSRFGSRVAMVVMVELLAAVGIIGALIAWACRKAAIGILALAAAIAANVILWAWARTFVRRQSAGRLPRGG